MAPEALVREYLRLQRFAAEHGPGAGCVDVLGWQMSFPTPGNVLSMLDYIAFRRMNDFVAQRPDPLILDCGANIGFTALWYKRRYPRARIIAFEPDPTFAPMLRRNLARNGAADVRVVESAAWIRDGVSPWIRHESDGSRLGDAQRNASHTVATVDLGRYLDELDEPVDLLKIDIEGAEFDVVPHLAARLARVRQILVECHIHGQQQYEGLARLLAVLPESGFTIALNSYGPWRDLIRRHQPGPMEAEQYLLLAGWRGVPAVDRVPTVTAYSGIGPHLGERDRQRQLLRDFGRGVAPMLIGGAGFDRYELAGPHRREGGVCWLTQLPGVPPGDSPAAQVSSVVVIEDDQVLGPAHALHQDIRDCGGGRYSHWQRALYWSTSDNSDPNVNGRRYALLMKPAAI